MKNERSVSGVFSFRSEAESAIQELKESGFSMSDISALLAPVSEDSTPGPGDPTKTVQGTATGFFAGTAVGGILGLLAGVGTLAIPGVGALIAAGPIMATLTGMGTGATVGTLAGALIGLGIPEENASHYEGKLQKGAIMLSVRIRSLREEKAVFEIFEDTGAEDIALQENWNEKAAVVDGTAHADW